MRPFRLSLAGAALALTMAAFAAGCEAPPVAVEQTGYRGTGMAQIRNPDLVAYLQGVNQPPPPPYPLEITDPTPVVELGIYENVQVLGDLSAEEFNHLMLSITEWVVPKDVRDRGEGCNYCHNPQNMASDEVYTKIVSRRMLQMTRAINTQWSSHVQNTGVTCYTCHRGQPVPAAVWALDASAENVRGLAGDKKGQNTPTPITAWASLPYDIFAPYIADGAPQNIRVNGETSLPTGPGASIKTTERTYGLMMHMSSSLGVNCTYCHNSGAGFGSWTTSTPQRVTAWHGLSMVRDVNETYITSLTSVFPANRLGPLGDPWKVNCATCHQGVAKPLYGVSMLPDHPGLGVNPQAAAQQVERRADAAAGDAPMAPLTP